jgi:anaerobic selenocysteine-containing dehydrogenase
MTDLELLDHALRRAGMTSFAGMAKVGWVDRALSFERAHFLTGIPQPDSKFHFKPDWRRVGPGHEVMRAIADWSDRNEQADARHPYKLVCPPARHFLNTTFSETPTSIAKERAPCVRIHPDAAAREGVSEECRVRIGNYRGSVLLMATLDARQQATTMIVEGIWPADAFEEKRAINTLIADDPVPPNGGAGFHDTAVWLQRARSTRRSAGRQTLRALRWRKF